MVLEEATSPTAESSTFDDDSGSTSGQSGNTRNIDLREVHKDTDLGHLLPGIYPSGYRIPFDQLPHPAPIFGPIFGFTKPGQMQFVIQRSANGAHHLRRQLTKDESDALAWHFSKAYMLSSLGYPIGLGGGIVRWYYTQALMKFPFYQPNLEKYKFQNFGPFKGRTAYLCWQTLRLNAYGFVGGWVGKQFFAAYAVSVMIVGQMHDGRLNELNKGLNKRREQDRKTSQADNRRQPDVQTASPTAGDYNERPQSYDQASYTTDVSAKDDRIQQADGWSEQERSPSTTRNNAAATLESSRGAQTRRTRNYDDASPVAQEEPDDSGADGSASAWERLRMGEQPSATQRGEPSNQQDTSTPAEQSRESGANSWARLRGDSEPKQSENQGALVLDELTDDDRKWR